MAITSTYILFFIEKPWLRHWIYIRSQNGARRMHYAHRHYYIITYEYATPQTSIDLADI